VLSGAELIRRADDFQDGQKEEQSKMGGMLLLFSLFQDTA
jgi:hypothetical protein